MAGFSTCLTFVLSSAGLFGGSTLLNVFTLWYLFFLNTGGLSDVPWVDLGSSESSSISEPEDVYHRPSGGRSSTSVFELIHFGKEPSS